MNDCVIKRCPFTTFSNLFYIINFLRATKEPSTGCIITLIRAFRSFFILFCIFHEVSFFFYFWKKNIKKIFLFVKKRNINSCNHSKFFLVLSHGSNSKKRKKKYKKSFVGKFFRHGCWGKCKIHEKKFFFFFF